LGYDVRGQNYGPRMRLIPSLFYNQRAIWIAPLIIGHILE